MEGIERIKVLGSEIEDKPLLKVIDYLISREDMNEKYLNEEKSLKQMVEFIKGEAKKQAKNGMAWIEDEVVFGWAIHYFDETNEALGLVKKEKPKEESTEIQKIEMPKETKKETETKREFKPEGPLQLSIFDMM